MLLSNYLRSEKQKRAGGRVGERCWAGQFGLFVESDIHRLLEIIDQRIERFGVSMTALQPGATDTDFFNKAEMQNTKIMDSKLSDPVKVAKDGYEAFMKGDDKIVSGFKNKAMVAMSNVMPDTAVAEQMNKMQKDKNREDK